MTYPMAILPPRQDCEAMESLAAFQAHPKIAIQPATLTTFMDRLGDATNTSQVFSICERSEGKLRSGLIVPHRGEVSGQFHPLEIRTRLHALRVR